MISVWTSNSIATGRTSIRAKSAFEYIFEAHAVLFRRYDDQSKAVGFSE